MSENQPIPTDEQLPIKKYLDSSRLLLTKVKGFEFRRLFEGLIVFFSIIAAYFIVELTYQHRVHFEKITKIKLNQQKTLAQIFFCLSLYLIFWNLVARFLKNRAMAPPKKADQYEQLPQEEPEVLPSLPPLPNGQKYYHQIIQNSLNTTIYTFLFLVSVLSYAYFNQPKIPNLPALVSIERINYLFIWFMIGNLFKLFGNITHKLTNIREFKVLGIAMKFIVGFMAIGLANGLNTFIFI